MNWRLLSSNFRPALFILLFIGIAGLRLGYCTRLPVNTGDLPRHLYYGLYTAKLGLPAVGHSLAELNPALEGLAWSSLPYHYPIVALLFFTAIAKLSPTIFFAKLALTLIEAVNSLLVFKYSRQHWLALLYWASPISIWWVSHEGQFEPLQNLFVLGALLALKERKCLAFVLLAFAIQTKVTAIFFVPLFIFAVRREAPKDLLAMLGAFSIGFMPTLIAASYYPVIAQVFASTGTMFYNPYYWNVLKPGVFGWNPTWLVLADECATCGMLLLFFILAVRRKSVVNYLAPVCFILFCKASPLCQFWYFAVFMPFLLPVSDRRERLLLFALTPLLDISSLVEIVSGPFGYTIGDYYHGLTAFTRHTI
jgi:hypothetical protein